MNRFTRALGGAVLALLVWQPARAQDMAVAEGLARLVALGDLKAAEEDFAKRTPDAQVVTALGMIRFLRGVERLGQNMYRYGLQTPRGARGMIPFLRLPVPSNPKPDELTYDRMRTVYAQFLEDMAKVDETLAKLPDGPVKLPLDLATVRLDLNGDGVATDMEALPAIIAGLSGAAMRPAGGGDQPVAPSFVVGFDRADAIWLRGYTHILSAMAEFILAYDWSETYGATAHLFFTGAKGPGETTEQPNVLMSVEASAIADAVALIHLIRWPLAEPRRMVLARDHLKQVIVLSRQNWKEILAETDDDREWLPGPQQKNGVFGAPVTQERVDGWLAALDDFEAALEGRKLIPHWRYGKGVDLNAVFAQPRPFDLVLWVTGHAAVPYLKDGPTISRENWMQWQRIFGGNFLGYAFWFN